MVKLCRMRGKSKNYLFMLFAELPCHSSLSQRQLLRTFQLRILCFQAFSGNVCMMVHVYSFLPLNTIRSDSTCYSLQPMQFISEGANML